MRNNMRVPLYFYHNEVNRLMGIETTIALAAIGLAGTQAATSAHEAHEQRKLAEKQQKEQERLAKMEAGKAPTNTENVGDIEGSNESKMSAIRRTILTRTQQSGTKLGD